MDPRTNPYAPGAGTAPPELAGRGDVIEKAAIALDRIRNGLSGRSVIMYGLRGVGKTVLLNHIRLQSEQRGFQCAKIEAPEGRSLPGMLVPALRASLLRMDRGRAATEGVKRALRAIAGFAKALKVKYQDIEVNVDLSPECGLADSGDLDNDLKDLFAAVGASARGHKTAVALVIDELQYVRELELAALIAALHETSQAGLPVTMLAAGLPQLLGGMGEAKSYAERLFEFVEIDRLDNAAARAALEVPAGRAKVAFEPSATEHILQETNRYPYFLQEWGKHSWNIAERSPITRRDAVRATTLALAELDASFFRVRFDRTSPAEKSYLRAMAALGPGPHRSGAIADRLGRRVTSVAPARSSLIRKGMIYSLAHGDTAFTVPLFDGFMKRVMPEE